MVYLPTFGSFYMVNVGKYTIHGCYGKHQRPLLKYVGFKQAPEYLNTWACIFGKRVWFTINTRTKTIDDFGGTQLGYLSGTCFCFWLEVMNRSWEMQGFFEPLGSGISWTGGGFKYFLFPSLFGEMIQFYQYFSDGLKPPTTSSEDILKLKVVPTSMNGSWEVSNIFSNVVPCNTGVEHHFQFD